jgi:hypothetical protein
MKKKRSIIKPEWNSAARLTRYWITSLVVLVSASFLPSIQFPGSIVVEALFHFILCSVLAFVPMVLLDKRKTAFLLSIAITSLGYLLEINHASITGALFCAIDALANNLGVLAGIGAGFIIRLNNHFDQKKARMSTDDHPEPSSRFEGFSVGLTAETREEKR